MTERNTTMTIDAMTIEHLGSSATEDDLEEFQTAAWAYVCDPCGISEQDAMDYLWGAGDYTPRLRGAHCHWCHTHVADQPATAVVNDATWPALAAQHADDCAWVSRRAP